MIIDIWQVGSLEGRNLLFTGYQKLAINNINLLKWPILKIYFPLFYYS